MNTNIEQNLEHNLEHNIEQNLKKLEISQIKDKKKVTFLDPLKSEKDIIQDFIQRGIDLDNEEKEIPETVLKEEELKKRKANEIRENEDDDPLSGNFQELPKQFLGIKTGNFARVSMYKRKSRIKSPFLELQTRALDDTLDFETRCQCIRYMQKIPVLNRYQQIYPCLESILRNSLYSPEKRYLFFSNNEKFIKLDYELVNYGHNFVYSHFQELNYPLIYKILSAQHILTQFPCDKYDVNELQLFLIAIANDPNQETKYRAECADILHRGGYGATKEIGEEIIKILSLNKGTKTTIYDDAQNVHNVAISEKTKQTLKRLMNDYVPTHNSSDIYEEIVNLFNKSDDPEFTKKRRKTVSSFQRIIIDTSRFEGQTVLQVLLLVWEKILTYPESEGSDNRTPLVKRLIEELYEMEESCSSGFLTKLLNVLNGFFEDYNSVEISIEDQLTANVFARMKKKIRELSNEDQEQLQEEILSCDKTMIFEFIQNYKEKEQGLLYQEFVKGGFISKEKFEQVCSEAIKKYFGIT